MHLKYLFLSILTIVSSCSDEIAEIGNQVNDATSSNMLQSRSGTPNDYFYTQKGISVKNSGIGPETWYGGMNEYIPFMIKYADNKDMETVPNSLLRVPWGKVEDENGYHFEKVFDNCFYGAYRNHQKICLGVFPIDSWVSNTVQVTATYQGKNRVAYINYPKYIHEQLMKSEKYRPRLYQNYEGDITDEDAPLYYAPDLRNPILYKKYKELMIAFRKYLDEEVVLDGKTLCRRMFVREIQIRHWGYFGEGLYRYLGPNRDTDDIQSDSDPRFDMETSDDLIKWGQIYTEVFPDIRLIAPSNGMWVTGGWNKYQYWLATAKNQYGEFGLFYDMWGENSKTAIGASNIVYNGIPLRPILLNKWRHAPIGGEPYTHFPSGSFLPYSTILDQVKLVRPAKILAGNLTIGDEPGNTTHWGVTERESNYFKEAYSMMGFRLIAKDADYAYVKTGHIKIIYFIQNIGLTPVYEPWDVYYVFRDYKTKKEVCVRKSKYDIRDLMPSDNADDALKIRNDDWSVVIEEFFNIPKGIYDVHLKITDPDGIVPNMKLSQPGYDSNGEYYLTSLINY